VRIKADRQVTQQDVSSNHLLLIGRPDSNAVLERMKDALPLTFGSRSFTVGQDSYAHANSAVLAAGANPLNARYSIVAVSGLSAAATLQAAPALARNWRAAEVLVLANGSKPRALVVSPRELVTDLDEQVSASEK